MMHARKRRPVSIVLTMALMTILGLLLPSVSQAKRSYKTHTGYLEDVKDERGSDSTDMVILQPPNEGPSIQDRIFSDSLSREFRDRYEERFGRTEVERVYNSPNRFSYYSDMYTGLRGTPQEINSERQRFAEYMLRRLTEVHVDNYVKNDPKAKVVWEAKEKISKVNVSVQKFKFDLNYNLGGNVFDMKVGNPWLSLAKVRLQMAGGLPGSVDETIVSLGRSVTETIRLEGHYYVTDGVVHLVGWKALAPALSASLSHSSFTKEVGRTLRQSLYLAGLSYTF